MHLDGVIRLPSSASCHLICGRRSTAILQEPYTVHHQSRKTSPEVQVGDEFCSASTSHKVIVDNAQRTIAEQGDQDDDAEDSACAKSLWLWWWWSQHGQTSSWRVQLHRLCSLIVDHDKVAVHRIMHADQSKGASGELEHQRTLIRGLGHLLPVLVAHNDLRVICRLADIVLVHLGYSRDMADLKFG